MNLFIFLFVDLKNFIITHDDRQKTHGIMITMVRYEKKVSSKIF